MKRKILSIILVVLMMFSLLIPIVAETKVTIIDGNTNATYEAYRLLKVTTDELPHSHIDDRTSYAYAYTVNETYRGVLTEVISDLLIDPMFPDNYNSRNPTEFDMYDIDPIVDYILWLDEVEIRIFADAVYKAIANILESPDGFHRPHPNGDNDIKDGLSTELTPSDYAILDGVEPPNNTETSGTLEDGYWLIVETTMEIIDGENTARSLVILDTAGIDDIRIEAKIKVPTVQKYVFDDTLYDTLPSIYGWGKIGDYGVSDEIPFLLIGTLPENFEAYQSYYYEFEDTFQGLTYTDDSMLVFIDTEGNHFEHNGFDIQNIPGNLIELHGYEYMISNNPEPLTVVINDLKIFSHQLTQNSKIYVYYTAKLNTSYIHYNYGHDAGMGVPANENTVILRYSNDISNNEYDMNSIGYTPSDSVKIFTYGIDLQKIDENRNYLSGAEFILYRGTHDTIDYYLTNNNGWVKNGDSGTTYDLSDIENASDIFTTSDDNTAGKGDFPFLDAGDYYLYEIKAPDGYNRLKDPTSVVIEPHYENLEPADEDGFVDTLVDLNVGYGDIISGLVVTEIQNKPGILLPTTGGIGTTMLYIGGTVLLLGSVFGLAIYFMINSRRRSVRRRSVRRK